MARIKGVFSWEDVLLQRYQSKSITSFLLYLLSIPYIEYTYLTGLKKKQATNPLPSLTTEQSHSPPRNPKANSSPGYHRSSG